MRYVRVHLAEHYAPATVNRILSAVRGVLRECQTSGYMSAEQRMSVSDIPPIPNSQLLKGLSINRSHISTFLEECNKDARPAGRRDAALLALLFGAGLRSSEVVGLDLDDYSRPTQTVRIRRGKGAMNRRLSVTAGVAGLLHRWLLIRGQEPGPFLVPISKIGRLQPRQLTSKAIIWILGRRALAANMPLFSPRDLRRTYLLDLTGISAVRWIE
jgi:integrase